MLESTRPYGAPVRPFMAAQVSYGVAREAWQERGYWALRREIFCAETQLFSSAGEERDLHDAAALPIVALAHSAGNPEDVVGIVRIFEAQPGRWYGGRLGVARRYRAHRHVGGGLIQTAVGTAKGLGCREFLATVLASNGAYFERHDFHTLDRIEVCGRPHLLMQADLHAFAALDALGCRRAA
jgi:putative N-acetyltransferase (TIGR04045 family)